MKTYDYILALDPSGAFHEGKGTTGWCLFKNNKIKYTGILSAKRHCCMESYWESHINLIDAYNKDNKGLDCRHGRRLLFYILLQDVINRTLKWKHPV